MQHVGYYIYRFVVGIIGRLPFKVLYVLSDGIRFLLKNVLKYRYDVVSENIARSFPDKSASELKALVSGAYLNFTDILMESFKTPYLSKAGFSTRFNLLNPEVLNRYSEKGLSTLCVAAHYANWEWGGCASSITLEGEVIGLYKPLKNPRINDYLDRTRCRFGTRMIPIYETAETLASKVDGVRNYVFVADQSPSNMREAIWIDFLNQDTACLHGPEKYVRMYGLPLIYMHMRRTGRGKYESELIELPYTQKDLDDDPHFVTKAFFGQLEKLMKEDPSQWLWTHRRWKRRREEATEQSLGSSKNNIRQL